MSLLKDKVALITGSSSGIGAAAAIKLAKIGANVVITGRNKDNLSIVGNDVAKLSTNGSKGVLQIVADVTNDDDCKRIIKETIDYYGKIDILVNNAGISAVTPISDPKLMEKFDKTMNTNIRSAVFLTHLTVPYLEKTKGNIINMSSIVGLRPFTPYTAYCMSKAAMDMFTKCLALELGPKGIRVNAINPGGVHTNFLESLGVPKENMNAVWESIGKDYPLGRIGESVDIANVIAFLASEDASFITGINLIVDGGGLWNSAPNLE